MATLKSGKFWAGVVVGAIVGPMVLTRVAPNLKAKLPAQS
jgi:hypothetical protein